MSQSMAAKHAIWPRENDIIFNLSERAQQAEKVLGKEHVINSTIGALMDDEGKLITLDSVYSEYKNLDNSKIAAYASIAGQKNYIDAVKKACFKEHRPKGHIRVVASPGGTGSIKLAVWNYTNKGDKILTSDWYWGPYNSITEEIDREILNYKLFDENSKFNIKSFKSQFLSLSKIQDRLFVILNTPAHNPTGYSISNEEWDKILDLSKQVSKDKEKKIILFVDVAYIDFSGREGNDTREFFEKFSDLPENILIIVGYSMSKGYTAYGMRSGACICISSSENVAEEFHFACAHSARANWSNCNRGAMELLSAIVEDEEKLNKYNIEKNQYKIMLQERAKIFVDEAKHIGLEILPYIDGFFISIPCENPREVCEKATEENVYVVPLKMGLRFAVCAVSKDKCKKAPAIIKRVIDSVNSKEVENI